jgi:hypothetical protein
MSRRSSCGTVIQRRKVRGAEGAPPEKKKVVYWANYSCISGSVQPSAVPPTQPEIKMD